MKRLILLIALLVILAGLSASAASDTSASLTDSNIPDNEITTSQIEASNSSTSATITITMYAVADKYSPASEFRRKEGLDRRQGMRRVI